MKKLMILIITLQLFSLGFASCSNDQDPSPKSVVSTDKNYNETMTQIKIKIGSNIFTAILLDNETADAFKKMLPLTINMFELNGNEKYSDLSTTLPINATNLGTIHTGDIMLYGSKTLVLFYKTFPTSYSYTKLGQIDDVSGFISALGTKDVVVTIELK